MQYIQILIGFIGLIALAIPFSNNLNTLLLHESISTYLLITLIIFTFSLLVFFTNVYLLYYAYTKAYNLKTILLISLVILFEIFLGVIMYYGDFPILSQPLHLFLATILFGFQFYWSLFFLKKT
mgnify:CR=1 FL=1